MPTEADIDRYTDEPTKDVSRSVPQRDPRQHQEGESVMARFCLLVCWVLLTTGCGAMALLNKINCENSNESSAILSGLCGAARDSRIGCERKRAKREP
jgi:hypothetical protein